MIAKKGLPTLRWRSPRPDHVLGDTGLADINPKLEHLAMQPWRSPQWIGDGHFADQLPDFGRYRAATRPASRPPAPIRSKAHAVPTQHCIRPNNRKRVPGIRKQSADPAKHP